jgi:hypothetical protein
MIFMAICYLIAVVICLFYPETAGKTLQEIDVLFQPTSSMWVFKDKQATKVGAIFERDMARGEALTVFGSALESEGTFQQVEDKRAIP